VRRPGLADGDVAWQFRRELRAVTRPNHPNVIKTYIAPEQFGVSAGGPPGASVPGGAGDAD
jgi:hypothetical protein